MEVDFAEAPAMTKKTITLSLDQDDQERLQREIERRGISKRALLLDLIRSLPPLPRDVWAEQWERNALERAAAKGSNGQSDRDRSQVLRF